MRPIYALFLVKDDQGGYRLPASAPSATTALACGLREAQRAVEVYG